MTNFDELAERAERGELTIIPGTVRVGSAAADAGRRALLDATGTSDLAEATRIALGRPRLDAGHGPSPVWRVRATENLDTEVTHIADRRGITKSLVIREAVEEYLRAHA